MLCKFYILNYIDINNTNDKFFLSLKKIYYLLKNTKYVFDIKEKPDTIVTIVVSIKG